MGMRAARLLSGTSSYDLKTGTRILIKLGGGGVKSIVGRLSEFRYTDLDTINRKTTLHYLHIQTRSMLGPSFSFHSPPPPHLMCAPV